MLSSEWSVPSHDAGGAQHAIDLITRTFLEPADLVCVEEPCFSGALHILRNACVRLLAVPVDGEGLQTTLLAAHLRRCQPKLILVQPTFHNPAGTVLSLSRRLELLDLAQRHDVPLVELDPYSGLRYDGPDLPPLKALDQRNFVIYVDSLPRVVSDEVRLAAVVAPRDVIRRLAATKSSTWMRARCPSGSWRSCCGVGITTRTSGRCAARTPRGATLSSKRSGPPRRWA